jgi:hypothetical protein
MKFKPPPPYLKPKHLSSGKAALLKRKFSKYVTCRLEITGPFSGMAIKLTAPKFARSNEVQRNRQLVNVTSISWVCSIEIALKSQLVNLRPDKFSNRTPNAKGKKIQSQKKDNYQCPYSKYA